MHNAAVSVLVLKVQKPPFAVGRVEQRTLVRAVDGGVALGQHHLVLEGTLETAGAKNGLPPLFNAAGWRRNVVPAVEFVQLGSLEGLEVGVVDPVAVKDHAVVGDHPGAIG